MCKKEHMFETVVVDHSIAINDDWQVLTLRAPYRNTTPYNRDTLCCEVFPGQFFNLRAKNAETLLSRPVSILNAAPINNRNDNNREQKWCYEAQVVILKKGLGTKALARLRQGCALELLGPLGNGFPATDEHDKVALVGGGIGLAPILSAYQAGVSNDLYLCFKTAPYRMRTPEQESPGGHDGLHMLDVARGVDSWSRYNYRRYEPANLHIATEDGSAGEEGMLDKILTAETLKTEGYTKVFACGPKPMLKYVRDICREVGVKAYLSLENYMACGVGACLGCTIPTTEGNKRCCKDGPVFDADILGPYFEIELPKKVTDSLSDNYRGEFQMCVELTRDFYMHEIGSHILRSPIIAASGTFGYGTEYQELANLGAHSRHGIGAICSKGLTLEPRSGNPGRRLYETASGLMNSIGLENPGIPHFIGHELNDMLKIREEAGTEIIANLSGHDLESYVEGARLLAKTGIDMIELNISCPNVKAGGMAFGMNPDSAAEVTAAVKDVIARTCKEADIKRKLLIVKLTPNAPDLVGVAMAVREAGADALSLVNTFQALAIDIETGLPVFDNVCAGLSGPAIKPIALRMVYDVAKAMNDLPQGERVPIIGIGGISTWRDAVEFIMAGATAVQVGTATFPNPRAMKEIYEGLRDYMAKHKFRRISELCGWLFKEH